MILFRDADGTRALENQLYEAKLRSIQFGFEASEYEFGVPMVPKPKSEAWILCALKKNPYQNCDALEEALSGNDNSPNSAKEQLREILESLGKSVLDLPDLVTTGHIAVQRIEMRSFDIFKSRLREVASQLYRS